MTERTATSGEVLQLRIRRMFSLLAALLSLSMLGWKF
jgi:hypothetical protein